MTTNIPKSRTLGDLLDELAKSYRDNEAVIWKDSRLTYSQLKEEVDIFARSLLSLGRALLLSFPTFDSLYSGQSS